MAAIETPVAFETVIDYRKQITVRRDRVRFIDIPPCRHFAIDGSGRPGDEAFQAAIGALYPVAYTVHFVLKRRGVDAPVGALEGLFWSDPALEPRPTAARYDNGG